MPEPLYTAGELVRAVHGRGEGAAVTGVTFDSREVRPGDLFVALQGERDGHDFTAGAFDKGAACALVTREVGGGPEVVVSDTLRALELLAAHARDRAPARRAAVTGSVGKTSATRAIDAALKLAGRSHASVKSFNNHIGVPLTLARMPRDTERAVFEIGMNHADEVGPLSRLVKPDVALVTTVGPVHIENFPDGEKGVARAKAEIFEGLKPGGTAVLNADNPWCDLLRAEANRAGARVLTFGSGDGADARLDGFDVGDGRAQVSATLRGRPVSFTLLQTGVHWGLNSLAVLLTLEALDVSLETALQALAQFAPIEGRGAEMTVRLERGVFTLVDESYNANPISMRAAFASLARRRGRKVAALTDMLELGANALGFHAELAQAIDDAEVDVVFCAGPLMKALWDSLPAARQGGYAASAAELAPLLVEGVRPGDVVMVKGSNGSKASILAAALASAGASREPA